MIEGKAAHANRAILSVRSQYFKVLLHSGGMCESIKHRDEDGNYMNRPILLDDISYEVFQKILQYIYTDQIQDISFETCISLLMASERFMLDRLKSLCEDQISRHITLKNAIPILIASYRHNAKGLHDIALEFILKNIQNPIIDDGLSEMKVEPDLLVLVVRRLASARVSPEMKRNELFGNGSEWLGTNR